MSDKVRLSDLIRNPRNAGRKRPKRPAPARPEPSGKPERRRNTRRAGASRGGRRRSGHGRDPFGRARNARRTAGDARRRRQGIRPQRAFRKHPARLRERLAAIRRLAAPPGLRSPAPGSANRRPLSRRLRRRRWPGSESAPRWRSASPRWSGGCRGLVGATASSANRWICRTAISPPCSPASAAPMAARRSKKRRSSPRICSPCWRRWKTICAACATAPFSPSASPAACAARRSSASIAAPSSPTTEPAGSKSFLAPRVRAPADDPAKRRRASIKTKPRTVPAPQPTAACC